MLKPSTDSDQQYRALTSGAGVADLGKRTLVALTGEDRHSFLHNMCTADIRSLTPGKGCEAFLTNAQGKILAYAFVFNEPDSLVLESAPGQTEAILAQLDRYLIREQVQLHDRGQSHSELLLAGAASERLLEGLLEVPLPNERLAVLAKLSTVLAKFGSIPVALRRVDVAGPVGFLVQCPRDAAADVQETLCQAGAVVCGPDMVETARIESGVPRFGTDITDKNLPQEVARDALAICFNKGCYIGQETVARIDALGHVNRYLCGVRLAGEKIPTAGAELVADGTCIGQVTSACFSPRLTAPLALAYLRRGHHEPGTKITCGDVAAEVVKMPVWGDNE